MSSGILPVSIRCTWPSQRRRLCLRSVNVDGVFAHDRSSLLDTVSLGIKSIWWRQCIWMKWSFLFGLVLRVHVSLAYRSELTTQALDTCTVMWCVNLLFDHTLLISLANIIVSSPICLLSSFSKDKVSHCGTCQFWTLMFRLALCSCLQLAGNSGNIRSVYQDMKKTKASHSWVDKGEMKLPQALNFEMYCCYHIPLCPPLEWYFLCLNISVYCIPFQGSYA